MTLVVELSLQILGVELDMLGSECADKEVPTRRNGWDISLRPIICGFHNNKYETYE
jgi:hypothetical protein